MSSWGRLNKSWYKWHEGTTITTRLSIGLDDDLGYDGDEVYVIEGRDENTSGVGTREDMVRLGMMIIENLMTPEEYALFMKENALPKRVIKEDGNE